MAVSLSGQVQIYSVTPNTDGSGTYSVLGQIVYSGQVIGDFVANFVDTSNASQLTVGNTYNTALTD